MAISMDSIAPLEEYLLNEPMDTMNLDKYAALLRLYQFYPQKMNDRNVLMIVIKSLIHGFEENCFAAIFYLVPEPMWEREDMKEILQLQDRLERCAFEVLWRELHYVSELFRKIHFETFPLERRIRLHILRVLRIAYKKVPLKIFLEFLNFSTLEEALANQEVQENLFVLDKEDSGYMTVPPLEGTLPSTKVSDKPQIKMDAANFLRAQVPVDLLGPILCPPSTPFRL